MSTEPMDWDTFQMARQLLAEERIGTRIRAIEAEEDAAFNEAAAAIRKRG